ncbi:MAG: hypothetical protein WCT04_01900 [Planctomycetota bacterium]
MAKSKFFAAGALMIAFLLASIVWFTVIQPNAVDGGLKGSDHFSEGGKTGQGNGSGFVPNDLPVVRGFVGDLERKGNQLGRGPLQPFVVGESLKLEADAVNAVEYRWTLNGEVLKEKDQEWSLHAERFYDVVKPGKHEFTVQVRGTDKARVSQEKKTELNILPLKIMRVVKSIIHQDDEHFVTGDTLNLEVEMASSMHTDLDFYKYRYVVNDAPIKHPEDGLEWTSNDSLSYVFTSPGQYAFKVDVRRTDQAEKEDSAELPDTIVSADAVLLSFDASPAHEKGAAVGSPVYFSSFPTSRFGKSECRIGVKLINAADYRWLPEENGTLWGEASRTWLPLEPGTYLVRCEIRELGKTVADDSREMIYTITDGNF